VGATNRPLIPVSHSQQKPCLHVSRMAAAMLNLPSLSCHSPTLAFSGCSMRRRQIPPAALIMLPGGNGMVEFGPDAGLRRMGGSFLLRMLPLWRATGFATAVLTPPNGMSLLGYRHTPAYATAIGEAVDFAAGRANVPVWLVGTSQGTTAAVGGAARVGGKIAGIVLMSSVTGRSSAGETLFDSEPGRVAVPVLIIANSSDTCPASNPKDAPKIAEALTQAPSRKSFTSKAR
jgi:pimeloyl-ACP methyl ester carboxylesterase